MTLSLVALGKKVLDRSPKCSYNIDARIPSLSDMPAATRQSQLQAIGQIMVPVRGIEPLRASRPTTAQVWPVYQMRHTGTIRYSGERAALLRSLAAVIFPHWSYLLSVLSSVVELIHAPTFEFRHPTKNSPYHAGRPMDCKDGSLLAKFRENVPRGEDAMTLLSKTKCSLLDQGTALLRCKTISLSNGAGLSNRLLRLSLITDLPRWCVIRPQPPDDRCLFLKKLKVLIYLSQTLSYGIRQFTRIAPRNNFRYGLDPILGHRMASSRIIAGWRLHRNRIAPSTRLYDTICKLV